MDLDFRRTSLADLAALVRTREVSSRELTEHALGMIDAHNPELNAFVAVDADRAVADADAIDRRVAAGDDPGPLAGIPIGVKDTEDALGFRTTRGSAALMAFSDPGAANGDSILVERLKEAGCVVVGKTNTPELAWKADTTNALFGVTRNPWDTRLSVGGSSGGTAAAIAAGMVPLATGSDGGGSIRIPAAVCGLSGFKPSLGRIPHGGDQSPDWGHLSSKGPMARTTADIALALDAVIGPDPTDLRSLPMPEPSWQAAVREPHVPYQVLWSPTLGYATPDPEVLAICERAVGVLEDIGAKVTQLDDVFAEDPVAAWWTLAGLYNGRTMAPLRGSDAWSLIDPGLVFQIESTARSNAIDFIKADDRCHDLNLRLVEVFHSARLLVTPTVAGPLPEPDAPITPWVSYTYPFNMTRSPAGTVCAGYTAAGVPVGLQLIGPQHGDLVVLRTMAALEDALGARDRLAPIGSGRRG